MPEFGASGPGFAIDAPELDHIGAACARPRCACFAAERGGAVPGSGGIAPLDGGDAGTWELRRMYFLAALRGLGAGRTLMAVCLDATRAAGFRRCYLETLSGMDAAQRLYERSGFACIPGPIGATGHFGCNRFHLRDL